MKIGYPDTKNKPGSPLMNRKPEKAARKAAKAYKKFAEADAEPTKWEKTPGKFDPKNPGETKQTKKAERKRKAGKRKLDKSRAITKDMSAEDRKKASKSFSKRMSK